MISDLNKESRNSGIQRLEPEAGSSELEARGNWDTATRSTDSAVAVGASKRTLGGSAAPSGDGKLYSASPTFITSSKGLLDPPKLST
jgi:hypothetical protein